MDLGHDFFLSAYLDLGGFRIGSHFTWQVLASVDTASMTAPGWAGATSASTMTIMASFGTST